MDEHDLKEIFDETRNPQNNTEINLDRYPIGLPQEHTSDKNHLYRYDFVEILIRIAEFRYM